MTSAPTNKVISAKKPRPGERAQARVIMLALVSFLLGVAATAVWFHFAPNRNAENSSSLATDPSNNQPPGVPAVNVTPSARTFVSSPPPVSSAAIEDVKQTIPNYASVSLADGTQLLREAALKQFAAAAKEMDVRVRLAEQRLREAQNGQVAAEQQAALKNLQQTQAEQTEKLQQIAAHLQTRIVALQQLKGVTP
jgi:hypothetical protein